MDDVAQFVAPGVVLAQTCEPDNPNYSRLQENLEVLEAAADAAGRRLEVVESPLLPYVSGVGAGLDGVSGPGAGIRMPAPYVNMVFVEGAVLLPLTGEDGEDEMHARDRRARGPRAGRPADGALGVRRRRAGLHHAAGARRPVRAAALTSQSCVASCGGASWSVSARTTRSRPPSLAAYIASSARARSSLPSRCSESVATPMLMLTPASLDAT